MKIRNILIVLLAISCQSAQDPAHLHDAQGGHITPGGVTVPTVDATIWTDQTELFVEYPALVVGKISQFATHFTLLDDYSPVTEGSVTISLIRKGKGIRQEVNSPDRAGIFTPSLQPKEAGLHQLVFDLNTSTISERIVISNVQVFGSVEEAVEKLGVTDEGGDITFLKEQAWKIDFQTAPLATGEVFDIISTSGVWKVAPSDYKTLVAASNGTVTYESQRLTEGTPVRKGQVLMTVTSSGLTSNNLDTEIRKAKANYEQSESEYERKKQLYTSKTISKADFEKAEQNYKVNKATYQSLTAGYTEGGKQVVIPFDGYIKSVSTNNGAYVSEGAPLAMITNHRSSLLETQVSSAYASQIENIHDIWYQPRSGQWSSLTQTGGTIHSVGKEVNNAKPLLSVFANINENVEMPEGSFTEVQLAIGEPVQVPVVPESALLEDYGSYSVIVQLSGESFERRPVSIGKRNGNEVEITSGIEIGERLVINGAYQVKMASLTSQGPAVGHVH